MVCMLNYVEEREWICAVYFQMHSKIRWIDGWRCKWWGKCGKIVMAASTWWASGFSPSISFNFALRLRFLTIKCWGNYNHEIFPTSKRARGMVKWTNEHSELRPTCLTNYDTQTQLKFPGYVHTSSLAAGVHNAHACFVPLTTYERIYTQQTELYRMFRTVSCCRYELIICSPLPLQLRI